MSATTLSQHTGVSVQFVEQILKPLKQNGLTVSVRGAAGGHRLARPADEISLGEVVRLMEGGITLTVCCGEKGKECPRIDGCLTKQAWVHLSSTLEKELDSISLASLLPHGDTVCPEGLGRVKRGNKTVKRTRVAAPAVPPKASKTIIRRAKGMRL